MWSWVAGIALLLLIGFLTFAGWKNNSNTASSGSSPPTTASRTATPPSTTGSGSSSPKPDHPGAIEERHAVTAPIVLRNTGPGALAAPGGGNS